MKDIRAMKYIIAACGLLILFSGCKKELPDIKTSSVYGITATTAKCGGEVTFSGEPKYSIYGICWDTKENPTVAGMRTGHKPGPREFENTITGLVANTTYYARAYATNSAGTSYGEQVRFTTIASVPVLVTSFISDIASRSATCGNIIISDGGSAVLSAGVCWDTVPGPTITSSRTIDSLNKNIFISHISGLLPDKTYFVKAYATNAVGTSYGEEKSVTTTKISETRESKKIQIFKPKPKQATAAKNAAPEIDSANIAAKVRPVAASGPRGKIPGDSVLKVNLTDIDGNGYNSVKIGTQEWMKENLKVTRYRDGSPITNISDGKAWSSTTSGGYCWYNNDQSNSAGALGALYNWYAVADPRKLCPDGWRVATDADWKTLEVFLGMTTNQADGTVRRSPGKAADIKNTTGWIKQGKGTNSTAFSALAAGFRFAADGKYSNLGLDGCWWTATEDKAGLAWLRNMYYYLTDIFRVSDKKNSGFSVRCIKE